MCLVLTAFVSYLQRDINVLKPFRFIASKTLNYLALQTPDFEPTWWRLFQKRVVRTIFDSNVFILIIIHFYFWL
jgi:hypothetical protein